MPAVVGAPARLKPRGIYLITGGLGGIGLALAEYLASRVQAKLVLVGRSSLPPRDSWPAFRSDSATPESGDELGRIRAVQRMEQLGAQVLVVKADVARVDELRAAIAMAENALGPIDGVIHAAGVAGGGLALLKTQEMADRVLAPKVAGLLALSEIFQTRKLDFLVLCSSINAIVGGVGQIDYCAANRFLDAFASWDRGRNGRPTLSLNWDTWQEVGMAVNTQVPESMRAQRAESLKLGIRPAEGTELFVRALDSVAAQRVLSPRDWIRLVESIHAPIPSAESRTVLGAASDTPVRSRARHARPSLLQAYVEPRSELERSLVTLWQDLLGIEPVGVDDDFLELGGHSLLAVQMNARIRELMGVELPINTVFENPTISGLVVAVVEAQTQGLGEEELLSLVDDIAGLTPAELQQRLQTERKEPRDA